MLKKNLLLIICATHSVCIHLTGTTAQPVNLPAKVQQLYQLQEVAEKINRIKPIGNYLLAVPPFIELNTQDIQQFLSAVPSGLVNQRSRKKQAIAMLEYIQTLWAKVVEQARVHKQITPLMRDYLIEIRAAIESAFRHDLLSGPLRPAVRAFLERQLEQKNKLIVRSATETPLFGAKSTYPFNAHNLNIGIAQTLNSYFSEQSILEQIHLGPLNPYLDLHVILQSIITEDTQAKQMIVSGISCSYDASSNIPHIVTVQSYFGGAKAICDTGIPGDTYYVHDGTIYPIIRKKINRRVADPDMMRSRLTPNAEQLHYQSTLNPQALFEIARATKLLEELYNAPVCVTFIKHDNTIYLMKVLAPNLTSDVAPTFFDPLYTDAIPSEKKISITPIKPFHNLVVVKKREKIILAPNVRTFIQMLNKRKNPENVAIGIIKEMPGAQSRDAQLLDGINVPVIWSSAFEQLRSWIDDRTFPLVFDVQQKIAFPFSRCRGFCTLFQGVQNGIYAHPLEPHISVLPEFMLPLNPGEREMLKPDEYFSGVTLARLFDLLKTGPQATAESALNTILFRLQKQISHEYITKKECAISLKPYDTNPCEHMEQMYAYVERVAYQLKMLFKRLSGEKATPANTLEKNFLVNILQAVILQKPDELISGTQSFMHLTQKA